MADPIVINPTLTLAGQAAAFNASNDGIELILTHVSFGAGHYDPDGDEVALVNPVGDKIPLAGGSKPTPYQLRMASVWSENVGQVAVGEIGYWSNDVLVFVWSKADGTVAGYKTDGVAYVLFNDLAFTQVPAGSIGFEIDPTESAAIAALAAHEGAANAHPQYLLRADVAKDAGPLALLTVAGTANALVLSLDAPEAELDALQKGQRFQFQAVAANTTAVTANVEGTGIKAIKKASDAGLVDLDPGDIKAGALYDLNYDGVQFQLGGGVGGGKAFQRFSFVAGVAQTDFAVAHVPGSLIVLRNGREVTNYNSAVDGSKVTMTTPCNVNDQMEFLAFGSFKSADAYTKAEIVALLKTSGGLPVGSMLPMPKGVVPPGYLELDGSVQSIAVYPDLAAYLGTTFNKGDEGAGNFRLPESRGEFLRGWDHGRGVDTGRTIGSTQTDALQNITGSYSAFNSTSVGQAFGGAFSGNGTLLSYPPNSGATQSGASNVSFDASRVARTSTETRPRNLAVMWCIKAWNAPINQGQIDIAALADQVQQLSTNNSVVGSVRNGKMLVPVASATATYTADEIIVRSPADGKGYRLSAFNKSVDLTTIGAGGMDVGVAPVSGYLAVYAIYNPTTKLQALLAVNASAVVVPETYGGANLPAGFTASALVAVVPTTSTGLIGLCAVLDRHVSITMAVPFSSSAQVTLGAVSIASTVPPNARMFSGSLHFSSTSGANLNMNLNATPTGLNAFQSYNTLAATVIQVVPYTNMVITVPQTTYVTTAASAGTGTFGLRISDYTF